MCFHIKEIIKHKYNNNNMQGNSMGSGHIYAGERSMRVRVWLSSQTNWIIKSDAGKAMARHMAWGSGRSRGEERWGQCKKLRRRQTTTVFTFWVGSFKLLLTHLQLRNWFDGRDTMHTEFSKEIFIIQTQKQNNARDMTYATNVHCGL